MLLDYQMPGLNGIEVLSEIRKRGRALPVIMITAHGSVERAIAAKALGSQRSHLLKLMQALAIE